jgi:hypothetical protein
LFGTDSDRECPVEVHLLDLTGFESPHWWDVPSEHKAKTSGAREELEELC